MTDVEIVSLEPDDWQAYRALRLEALKTDPQAFGSTYDDNLQRPEAWWRERLASVEQNNWLLFAQTPAGLAGMIGAVTADDGSAADIISMFVRPTFRRQGIARALMVAALDKIGQNPAVNIVRLEVNRQQRAAVQLYESFGFQVTRTENGVAGDGQAYDISIMEKAVNEQ